MKKENLVPVLYRIKSEQKKKVKAKASKEEVSESHIIRKLISKMK